MHPRHGVRERQYLNRKSGSHGLRQGHQQAERLLPSQADGLPALLAQAPAAATQAQDTRHRRTDPRKEASHSRRKAKKQADPLIDIIHSEG